MSQWTDRVTSHAAFTTASTVEDSLDQAGQILPADPEAIGAYQRLKTVIEHVIQLLRAADPALIHPSTLANLLSPLQHVQAELNAFLADKNPSRLQNANTYADALLTVSGQLPIRLPARAAELAKLLTNARDATQGMLRSFATSIEVLQAATVGLTAKVDELTSEIGSQKGRLDTAITQYQQQFASAEDSRRNEFNQAEQLRAEAARQEETRLRAAVDTLAENLRATFAATEKQLTAATDALATSLKSNADDLIIGLQNDQDRAKHILGVISESGMVHGYQRVANDARESARFWHKVAGGAMVGLIAFAIFAFVDTLGQAFNWATFGGRAFVALTFGILAAYAAQQADRSADSERKNRRQELELAALDPFLEPLPENERIIVKKQMAERLFGQADVAAPTKGDTTGSILDVLKLAIQALAKK